MKQEQLLLQKKKPIYCTQNDGQCEICSLSNYGRDCRNNPIRREENE
jgi:hypothetical protein